MFWPVTIVLNRLLRRLSNPWIEVPLGLVEFRRMPPDMSFRASEIVRRLLGSIVIGVVPAYPLVWICEKDSRDCRVARTPIPPYTSPPWAARAATRMFLLMNSVCCMIWLLRLTRALAVCVTLPMIEARASGLAIGTPLSWSPAFRRMPPAALMSAAVFFTSSA